VQPLDASGLFGLRPPCNPYRKQQHRCHSVGCRGLPCRVRLLCAAADAQSAHDWPAAPLSATADVFRLDASQQQQHRDGGAAVEVPPPQPQPIGGLHHHAATAAAEARTLGQVRGVPCAASVADIAVPEAPAFETPVACIVHPGVWPPSGADAASRFQSWAVSEIHVKMPLAVCKAWRLSPLKHRHGTQLERLSARHSFGDAHARRQHGGPSAHAKVMMWDMSAPDPDGLLLPPPISGRGARPEFRLMLEWAH